MPVTAGSSAIAALSIAGVPPLNGFASKWLILATCLLAGLRAPLFLALGIVGLFISLVTLASFLKVIGAVFLGQPADDPRVREVPPTMVIPQVILAALCVLFGVFPQAPLRLAHAAVASAVGAELPPIEALAGTSWSLGLAVGGVEVAAWAPLAMVVVLAVLGALAYGIQRAGAADVRQVEVWTCGEPHRPSLVRYPATSFFQPFKHAFHGVYPTVRLRAPAFPVSVRRALDLDRWFYLPIARAVERTAAGAGRAHAGIPQLYLLWIVVGAAAVVGVALWAMR